MKIGLVGFGNQAKENIIPACSTIFGVEITAICDTDEARRREAQAAFPKAQIFKDYLDMMDSVRLDAVIAACYPTDHYNIAIEAISRKIAVFIEKPLAPSSGQVKRLVEVAANKCVTTGVGMNFRFTEVTRRLNDISGGDINAITLRQHSNKPVTPFWDYSSVLRSFLHAQTIHGLDFLIHLCGPVQDIRVAHNNRGNVIIMAVVLEFDSGAHGTLLTSNTSPHFVFDFDAICREKVHVNSTSLWSVCVSELGKAYHGGETKKWQDHWSPSPLVSGYERSGYHGQFAEFFAAIKEGRESSLSFASLRETYRCMDVIEALCHKEHIELNKKVSCNGRA